MNTAQPSTSTVAGLLVLAATVLAGRAGEIEERRAAIEKWVETKRLISQERQEWRTAKVILEDRVDLVGRETEDLKTKTEAARSNITKADKTLSELKATNAELKEMTAGLEASIATLEQRVLSLLAACPTPIRERVKPLSQRIPLKPAETKMGMSERFQNVVGILNELGKFSGEIMEASEVRKLPDGTKAEVAVLYLGIGQAYYCNVNGGVAGIGRPVGETWGWEADNTLVQAVSDVQAIFRNEKPAVYIPIPAEVR